MQDYDHGYRHWYLHIFSLLRPEQSGPTRAGIHSAIIGRRAVQTCVDTNGCTRPPSVPFGKPVGEYTYPTKLQTEKCFSG